jgi:hypothetical protein
VQPYQVGSKNKRSLVVLIPAEIVKEYNIDTSTIFAVQLDEQKKSITLQVLDTSRQAKIVPVAASFQADSNQVSEGSSNNGQTMPIGSEPPQ